MEMDALLQTERILQTIQLGESQFREFKSAWEGPITDKKPRDPRAVATDIAETLVSFANAEGGDLLVGVEDDGQITGIGYSADTVAKLLQAPISGVHPETPLDGPIARRVTLSSADVLHFAVDKGVRTVHQTSSGRCLQRRDKENRPVALARLQFERQEQISREYDRQIVDGAHVVDLDFDLLQRVCDSTTKSSPEKFLQFMGLAEYSVGGLRLRRAALLLFAKDVLHWHPRCEVRVVRIPGTELKTGRDYRVISDERASGNILELIAASGSHSAWERLRPHLVETKMTPDAIFKERVMYPEDACREALINAITHRDYSIEGQSIEIQIFDDRMEMHSPGNLLSTITVDGLRKLQGLHESRNALIARVLREIGYVREMGEGIRRIFHLMRDADLVSPDLISGEGRFSIVLRHKSVFSDEDQRWLDGFKALRLTRDEMLIALLGRNGDLLSPQQICDRLGLVDWDLYRQTIDQIQIKGIVHSQVGADARARVERARNKSKRRIPRLVVRGPAELEGALSDLYAVLQNLEPVTVVTPAFLRQTLAFLQPSNPYRNDVSRLGNLLRLIGLMNEERQPTALMQTLWRQRTPANHTIPPSTTLQPSSDHQNLRSPSLPNAGTAKSIFVGNLSSDTSRDDVKSHFEQVGTVMSVSIPIDYVTQRNRGFAFVRFATQEEAERALGELGETMLRGRVIRLDWDRES